VHVELCRDRACTIVVASFVAVGSSASPPRDLPTGTVFWRLRGATNARVGSATSPVWQFTVGARSAPRDTSWGTTLDVNGDGFADLAVAARRAASGAGRVYIYLGGTAGITGTPAAALMAPEGGDNEFGFSLASAGDVNGDGYADLLVGQRYAPINSGRAYVYLGGPAGLATTPVTTLAPPDGPNGRFGHAVSSAGDVNNDGYADVVIGASGVMSEAGRAYVYLGSVRGLGATPATTLTGQPSSLFGSSVAGAGDVNGDGFADVIVGATGTLTVPGHAYVYLGSPEGLETRAVTSLRGDDGVDTDFGDFVACAGDVNGDGLTDVAVGAPFEGSADGNVHVYLGSATLLGAAPSATLRGFDRPFTWFGHVVSGAGDVNGDGFGDFAVGAALWSTVQPTQTFRTHLYAGSVRGLGSTPVTSRDGPVEIHREGGDGFSFSVVGAGDVNGDGFADVAMGAYTGTSRPGHVYVYLGGPMGFRAAPIILNSPDGPDGLFGSPVARRGVGVTPRAGVVMRLAKRRARWRRET
jgi:hypothetical protein